MLENLTKQDMIILIGLVALIVITSIICVVISCTDRKSKKKVKKTEVASKPDINMALATDKIPEISDKAPELEDMFNETKKHEETPEILEEDFIEELDMGVEDMQDEKNRSSIESVLEALNEDIEKQKYDRIDRYEEEQEENAVISYQELLARKMALNSEEPVSRHVTEVLEEDSFIEDNGYRTSIDNRKIEINRDEKVGHFSSSDFISPVFGRQENSTEYPTVKKVTETTEYTHPGATKEELDLESDDFLDSLKKFRSNL